MTSFIVNAISFLNSNTAAFSTSISLTGYIYIKWFKSTVLHFGFFPRNCFPSPYSSDKILLGIHEAQKAHLRYNTRTVLAGECRLPSVPTKQTQKPHTVMEKP